MLVFKVRMICKNRFKYYRCTVSLQLKTRMNGRDSSGEVFVSDASESRVLDELLEGLLVRELSNAFHEVLVGVPVPGKHLAQGRNHLRNVYSHSLIQWIKESTEKLYLERVDVVENI